MAIQGGGGRASFLAYAFIDQQLELIRNGENPTDLQIGTAQAAPKQLDAFVVDSFDWLNLSLNAFKIKSKILFLS